MNDLIWAILGIIVPIIIGIFNAHFFGFHRDIDNQDIEFNKDILERNRLRKRRDSYQNRVWHVKYFEQLKKEGYVELANKLRIEYADYLFTGKPCHSAQLIYDMMERQDKSRALKK